MKKIIFIALIFLSDINVSAQNIEDKKYLLTSHSNSVGPTRLGMTDPYLSPLVYSGMGMSLNNEKCRFLVPENINYSMRSKLSLSAGLMLNPSSSSSMTYIGVNHGWGLQYHWRPKKGLQVLVGGLWDVDFGFKNVARNANNPVNIDLATNLNLSGTVLYDIQTRKRVLRLKLAVETPLFGYMFVPQGGASYYEMISLGNLTDAFHFSSIHNKRGLNRTLSIEVPLNRSTWRFGFGFNNLKYSANHLVFVRKEYNLLIGTTFDVATFAGTKNKAPRNFISTND